jgi:hypothetical protein
MSTFLVRRVQQRNGARLRLTRIVSNFVADVPKTSHLLVKLLALSYTLYYTRTYQTPKPSSGIVQESLCLDLRL